MKRSLALLFSLTACLAAAGDELPKTVMTQRGQLLVSEDLAQAPADVFKIAGLSSLKSGWSLRPGQWDFVGGALRGAQLAADHHSAAAFFAFAYQDAILQFDIRLDGCRQVLFCVDDAAAMRPATPTRPAQERVEHLCRVIVNKDGFAAQKDDHDHDGPDQNVPFGKVALPIQPGEWKTVLVELKGDAMVASMDGRSISGAHPLLASAKAYFSFGVTGESASFRRLRIWEALPNPDWAQSRNPPAP